MKIFRYSISGIAAEDQSWHTTGIIKVKNASEVFDVAMRDSFQQLTQGKAVYGKPGVGCVGPYELYRILIERVLDENVS